MNERKFFVCRHCGNLALLMNNAEVPMVCCGEKMEELVPNTVEASGEKHIPVVEIKDGKLEVSVGSVAHPMLPAHSIRWIYVETENGGMYKMLNPGEEPKASFPIGEDKPIAVYEYCNLHGLWKTEL